MTFDELVTEVCERLNLTSDEAKSRVGRNINNRYRRLTSSIGLDTSRRTQVSTQSVINNRTLTFTGIEKILAVIDKSLVTTGGQEIVLSQIMMDEMHITPLRDSAAGMPRHYAVTNMHSTSVDIYVDIIPTQGAASATVAAGGSGYSVGDVLSLSGGTETKLGTFVVATLSGSSVATVTLGQAGFYTALPSNPVATTGGSGSGCKLNVTWASPFTLYADGIITLVTLAGNQRPDFPESFHDTLVFGAMADEYRKMEKPALMQDAERNYESRLADLRMFIAKSAYLDIHQGRYNGKTFRWTRDAQLLWDQ